MTSDGSPVYKYSRTVYGLSYYRSYKSPAFPSLEVLALLLSALEVKRVAVFGMITQFLARTAVIRSWTTENQGFHRSYSHIVCLAPLSMHSVVTKADNRYHKDISVPGKKMS